MSGDLLNPRHPNNPSQQLQEPVKTSEQATTGKMYHENTEQVYLPSKGLFYLGKNKGLEFLKVRPLDYRDEDILTTESYYTNNTIFDEIINATIIDDNGFKASNLVPIDRDTILLWLRSTAFGNEFTVEYKCPMCGGGNGHTKNKNLQKGFGEITWKLDELIIPEYPEEVYKELTEEGCYTVTTPLKGVKVKLIVPTIGQQNNINKRYQKKKEDTRSTQDFFATSTLLSVISGVEISENKWSYDKQEIDTFFRQIRLPLSDSRYLLKKVADITLKYDTKKTFTCPDCNHIEEGVEMPLLHKNFFWIQPE